ncbi:MAG: ferredoxin [Candidatus Neomarinimicrobiota bacterium]
MLSLSLVWVLKYTRAISGGETGSVALVDSGSTLRHHSSVEASEVQTYRVIIDTSRCFEGAASGRNPPCDQCVRACPEVFEKQHASALARVRRDAEPGRHLPAVREAARRCPTNAILLVELAPAKSSNSGDSGDSSAVA